MCEKTGDMLMVILALYHHFTALLQSISNCGNIQNTFLALPM